MTEAEARVCGASANRIVNLRGLQVSNKGTVSLTLTQEDIAAFLALAIEREIALLLGFNIVLETPAS